jgi:hypothetical protein
MKITSHNLVYLTSNWGIILNDELGWVWPNLVSVLQKFFEITEKSKITHQENNSWFQDPETKAPEHEAWFLTIWQRPSIDNMRKKQMSQYTTTNLPDVSDKHGETTS